MAAQTKDFLYIILPTHTDMCINSGIQWLNVFMSLKVCLKHKKNKQTQTQVCVRTQCLLKMSIQVVKFNIFFQCPSFAKQDSPCSKTALCILCDLRLVLCQVEVCPATFNPLLPWGREGIVIKSPRAHRRMPQREGPTCIKLPDQRHHLKSIKDVCFFVFFYNVVVQGCSNLEPGFKYVLENNQCKYLNLTLILAFCNPLYSSDLNRRGRSSKRSHLAVLQQLCASKEQANRRRQHRHVFISLQLLLHCPVTGRRRNKTLLSYIKCY